MNQTPRQKRIKHKEKLRHIVREIKETSGCIDCGIADWRVLDYDHVKGNKVSNVNLMTKSRVRLSAILEEISKCEVRCSNCHRIRTIERMKLDY